MKLTTIDEVKKIILEPNLTESQKLFLIDVAYCLGQVDLKEKIDMPDMGSEIL